MRLWFVLGVAFLLGSCNLVSTNDPAVVTSIEEELRLDLWNPLGQEHNLQFNLSTIDPKCETSEILVSHGQQGNSLHVGILGLKQQAVCQGKQFVLMQTVPATIFPGTYQMVIELGETIANIGILTFDGSRFTLNMQTSDGLMIGHDELYKIPERTIWGSLSSDQNINQINTDFLNELDQLGYEADLSSGYYGHFTILDADVQLAPSVQRSYTYPFVYTLTGQVSNLQNIVATLRAEHGESVIVECTTWDGQNL